MKKLLLFVLVGLTCLGCRTEHDNIDDGTRNLPNPTAMFELNEFQGNLYFFCSYSGTNPPAPAYSFIKTLTDDSASLRTVHKLELYDKGFQVRATYNDNDERFFIGTAHTGADGDIYLTFDMQYFTHVFHSEEYGFRSLIKYKDYYLAGTDNGSGILLASTDGLNWSEMFHSDYISQLNKMFIFNDMLYFVDNKGVSRTSDLINFEMVFPVPEDHLQIYAAYPEEDRIYVGTGWAADNPDHTQTEGRAYVIEDDIVYSLFSFPETPMPYFFIRAREDNLLMGGYASNGVIQIDEKHDTYFMPFEAPGNYYTARQFGDSIYIGTYGLGWAVKYQDGVFTLMGEFK